MIKLNYSVQRASLKDTVWELLNSKFEDNRFLFNGKAKTVRILDKLRASHSEVFKFSDNSELLFVTDDEEGYDEHGSLVYFYIFKYRDVDGIDSYWKLPYTELSLSGYFEYSTKFKQVIPKEIKTTIYE